MSGSNRGEGTKALAWPLPLIGIVLAIGLAWGIGWSQAREEYKRQQTPAAYAAAAKKDAQRACVGTDPTAVFECVNEKVETAYQTAHDEQDLSAQQRAASSALAAAMIGFLTLAISIVGVWFVKRTLDATLEAVEDTGNATRAMLRQNEISERTQRPWVTVGVENVVLKRDGGAMRMEADIVMRNVGQIVARNYQLCIKLFYSDTGEFEKVEEVWASFDRAKKKSRKVLMPNETDVFPFWSLQGIGFINWSAEDSPLAGGVVPTIAVSILYQSDLTGDLWLRTDKAYALAHKTDNDWYDSIIDRDLSGAKGRPFVVRQISAATLGD